MVKRKFSIVDVLHIGHDDSNTSKSDSSQINHDSRFKPFRNFIKFSKKFKKLNCSSDVLNMELTLSRKSTSDGENSMSQDSSSTFDSFKQEVWSSKELNDVIVSENDRYLDYKALENQDFHDQNHVVRDIENQNKTRTLFDVVPNINRFDHEKFIEILDDHSKDKDTPSRRADYVHSLLSGRSSLDDTIDLVNRVKTETEIKNNNYINDYQVKKEPTIYVKKEIVEEIQDNVKSINNEQEEEIQSDDEQDKDDKEKENKEQEEYEDNTNKENNKEEDKEKEQYQEVVDEKEEEELETNEFNNEDNEENSVEIQSLKVLDSEDYVDYLYQSSDTSKHFNQLEFEQDGQTNEIDRMISMYRKIYNYRNFNKNLSGDGKLRVVVRCRPSSSNNKVVECEKTCVKLLKPGDVNSVFKSQRPKVFEFNFDYIVQENETTEQLYRESCVNLVQKIIEGTSVTVFAYGSTGSGKTYTISGDDRSTGLIFLAMSDLFCYKEQCPDIEFYISYFEVYNENIYDLLRENERNLHLQEHENKVFVKGLTKVRISSYEDFKKVFDIGNRNRKVFTTNANRCSSRSHAILQIQTNLNSKLTFIDLAGSERMKITENTGERLKESSHINQSLLALINCINTLSRNSNHSNQYKCQNNNIDREVGVYYDRVKYRDSKLTHLLKNSLSSSCFIVMIAHVNPESKFYQDSYNTIKYALRAKDVEITQVITKEGCGKEIMKSFSNELLYLLKFMKKQMNSKQLQQVKEHISQSSLVGQTLLLNLLQ